MFRIKKLDIFIAKQFLLLFVATFFVCLFVLMMQFLWRYIDELIGKGLSMEVMAQFFWYMMLMLVPQALPLAILLSSLITFGNLGESSELTAIKAAGISLIRSFRSLIFLTVCIMLGSMYFQNVIGPNANMSFAQLLISMKQKSPELEIPEGIFYDGIPQTSLYVQKKDPQTGMLYGMMIFRQTDSFEDAAIILADSGMMQSTAEKKHLLLTLHSGEWFENMRGQDVGSASVPYRRETFARKQILLDFDADFNLTDAGLLSNNAKAKSLEQIRMDVDSMNHQYDSIGRVFYKDVMAFYFCRDSISKSDSLRATKMARTKAVNVDTLFNRLSPEQKQRAMTTALNRVNRSVADQEYKELITGDGDKLIRQHRIEALNKFTLALSCLLFFFIGAPLGAIIRKGGLGIPVIISVLVFIVYYIFDNTGYRMARGGMWAVWFGKSLPTAVLAPLAVFFTYTANNDSVVFNIDLYRNFFMKLLGLRLKRHVTGKEVIINDPDYTADRISLTSVNNEITTYAHEHKLWRLPNPIKVFFRYEDDHEIERIVEVLEGVIEDLMNTRDKKIITELSNYPIVSPRAHTRVFNRRWMNIISAIILPVGLCIYLRMWMFRLRLYRDLKVIKHTNSEIIQRIEEKYSISK
ncbi:MAG: LptF/LptG family permease [Prevotella sp.]|nr:LptF/LptG family permease [Prevotella sp.]